MTTADRWAIVRELASGSTPWEDIITAEFRARARDVERITLETWGNGTFYHCGADTLSRSRFYGWEY